MVLEISAPEYQIKAMLEAVLSAECQLVLVEIMVIRCRATGHLTSLMNIRFQDQVLASIWIRTLFPAETTVFY